MASCSSTGEGPPVGQSVPKVTGQKRPASEMTKPGASSSQHQHHHGPAAPKRMMFQSMDPAVALSTNPANHDRAFPYFRRPHIVGSFSVDGDRRLKNDRHQMKFLHERLLRGNFNISYIKIQIA